MKTMIVAAAATLIAVAWYLLPSPPQAESEPMSGAHAGHTADPAALSDGVVLQINSVAGSVTISHGPLYNLGMPSMTMGFRISDPSLLERLKPGDTVKFHADAVGGELIATRIEIAN